jgi:Flagellar hook-length control protein FliK
MQNLRTFAAPYLFLDLPFPPDAPISRAQIHVFGEGGRGRHFDRRNASITLDLSTPRLGDLWISLTITGGACTCVVRAAREATVAAITAATPELGQALAEAGYPDASVQVTSWSGNRLEETAQLMRRFSGLDVRA